MNSWIRRLVVGLLLVLLLGASGFVIWGSTPLGPMPEATAALRSDAQVTVTTERWLTFAPVAASPTVGLIFYPGGRVDPRAYAPAARAIAEEGYLIVIVPMPLNLAVFSPGRATALIAAHPEIAHWAIGGHSLGGAMAAKYVFDNPDAVEGLVLWASYPAESNDLSHASQAVVSIYGALDGLATVDKIAASRALLPTQTRWVEIAGGNHAQFGWYGPQGRDNPATISREAQQVLVVEATVALLEGLGQ